MRLLVIFFTFTALCCDVPLSAVYIEDLQQEVDNHDTELRILHERVRNQEMIIDSLRDQVLDANLANSEHIRGSSATLENRISGLETTLKVVINDIRQLREHSNDSSKMLNQQKDDIDTLHSALESLVAVLQPESANKPKYIVVVSGDSLDKIARKNNTTVQKLKSNNGLKNDKIFVGQKLKL